MDSSVVATLSIFLLGTWYLIADVREGINSMDTRHYSCKKIFIDHGDQNTELELVGFFETGIGELQ